MLTTPWLDNQNRNFCLKLKLKFLKVWPLRLKLIKAVIKNWVKQTKNCLKMLVRTETTNKSQESKTF